jgi:hypothetical protein
MSALNRGGGNSYSLNDKANFLSHLGYNRKTIDQIIDIYAQTLIESLSNSVSQSDVVLLKHAFKSASLILDPHTPCGLRSDDQSVIEILNFLATSNSVRSLFMIKLNGVLKENSEFLNFQSSGSLLYAKPLGVCEAFQRGQVQTQPRVKKKLLTPQNLSSYSANASGSIEQPQYKRTIF